MGAVCVIRGFHVFIKDCFVVSKSGKKVVVSYGFLVGFLRIFIGVRQLGYRSSSKCERRFDVDFPVKEECWSRDTHHPEVGGCVNLADGGFEVIDRCVHDVGCCVVI